MTDIDSCFDMIGDVPTALTFVYLVHKADEEGRVNATYEDMAKALNRSRTMMYKYVARLVKLGLAEQRGKQEVNKWLTRGEQKKTLIYIPQISHYKQVGHIGKSTEVNKRLTSGEQEVNKRSAKNANPKRTLDERKRDFVERLKPYMGNYGKDMLNDFYRYWAQVNDGGTKMLWEKQKCFEIGMRLATWKRNETERGRRQTRPEDIGMVLAPEKDKFKNEETW